MGHPVLLSLIESSMGELNWIAPCLARFHERFPEWRIFVVVLNPKVMQAILRNTPLTESLQGKARLVEAGPFFSELLPRIGLDNIRVVLRDYSHDKEESTRFQCLDIFPHALHAVHPHSNHIYANSATDAIREQPTGPPSFRADRFDLLFLNSRHDLPVWTEHTPLEQIRCVGSPCYDGPWLDTLLGTEAFRGSAEVQASRCAGSVILYISRGEHHLYQSTSDYAQLLTWTMERLLRIPDSLVLIKAHPRQDEAGLHRMLQPYPASRWRISRLPLPLLARLSNFVVATWSSGIIDALAVSRPVIEFFKFPRAQSCWRIDGQGRPTSIYRELGLALEANDDCEFDEAVRQILTNRRGVLAAQLQNLDELGIRNQDAAEKVCAILFAAQRRKLRQPATGGGGS